MSSIASSLRPSDNGNGDGDGVGDGDDDDDGVDVDDLGHLFYRRNSLKIRLQMGFRRATNLFFLLHTPPLSPPSLKFHASWEWIAAAQLQLSTADRTKAKLEAAIFVQKGPFVRYESSSYKSLDEYRSCISLVTLSLESYMRLNNARCRENRISSR